MSVLVVKSLLFFLDYQPGFQFGDSGAYLATALIGWIPPDRSFSYGLLIRPLVLHSHSLIPLLVLQTGMSSIASVIVGFLLSHFYGLSSRISIVFALLSSIEPLQLMFERYVMAETAAIFGFSLFTLAGFYYLQSGKLWILLLCQMIGVVLVSLRFSFLPLVLVLSVVLPILAQVKRTSASVRGLFVSLVVSILVSQVLLFGYRHLYGSLAGTSPAYLSRDGEFLVADMAPLIKLGDFPVSSKRELLFQRITIPLGEINKRRVHRWLPGGICAAILDTAGGDEELANKWARETALRAIKRDPLGVLSLAIQTYREFFSYHKIEWALKIDQGKFVEPTQNDVAMIKDRFGVDTDARRFHSLTQRWELAAAPWYWLVIVLPWLYGLIIFTYRQQITPFDYLLLLMSFTFLLTALVPVEIANPRYLVPLPWLSVLILGVIYSKLSSGRKLEGRQS